MAISKKRKDELVAFYMDLLSESRAVFLTEYTGLDVKSLQQLRGEVRKVEGAYHITKNTLLLHALEQSGQLAPEDKMVGQLATGFALNEAPSLAKTLVDFAKKDERLVIKGGILGSEWLSAEQVTELAKLPSREELRAQIIGMIQAPARSLVTVVTSGVRQVVNVIDAYASQEAETEIEAEAAA